MGQGKAGDGLPEMAESVRPFVPEVGGVGRVTDADGVEDNEERLLHGSNSHGMPRGLELDRVEDAVGIAGELGVPVGGCGEGVLMDALEVFTGPGLKGGKGRGIARGIDDRIHVNVSGEPGREFGTVPGEQVDDSTGKIARGEGFTEGRGG